MLGLAAKGLNYSTVLDLSFRQGIGLVLAGRVNVGTWGEYKAKTMFIGQDNEYPDFEKLEELCSDLVEIVSKWMVDSANLNAKQMLLDFREFGKENLKMSLEEYDFDSMTLEDATAKAMELLEKQGAVVMMQDDANDF